MTYQNFSNYKVLGRDFYCRDTSTVARELMGKVLVKVNGSENVGGVIVETEAYYGRGDPASHAFRGATPRAGIMFGRPGISYVYLCYGMYYLLNVVTEMEESPGAVLVRALEPVWGIDIMRKRRGTKENASLTSGPGKLTAAMSIDGDDNGKDLTKIKTGLNIFDNRENVGDLEILVSERIGIKNGKGRLLRYFLKNNKFVSNT